MADEKVAQSGVNDGAGNPPIPANQTDGSTPPAGERPADSRSEQRIPLPRFNEVIDQRNQAQALAERLELRLKEMETRLPPAKPAGEEEVERLTKAGVPEATARQVVAVAENVGNRKNREVQAQLAQYQLAEWHREMERKHSDYRETAPDMEKVFTALPPVTQQLCMSSPAGLEMLYNQAKAGKSITDAQKAFEAGAQSVVSKKAEKLAVSSIPGGSSGNSSQELTGAIITAMSPEEFKKRQVEINAWVEQRSKRR